MKASIAIIFLLALYNIDSSMAHESHPYYHCYDQKHANVTNPDLSEDIPCCICRFKKHTGKSPDDDCELKDCFARSDTFREDCYATNGTVHGLTIDICVCRADWCTSLPYSSSTSLATNFAIFGVLALSILLK